MVLFTRYQEEKRPFISSANREFLVSGLRFRRTISNQQICSLCLRRFYEFYHDVSMQQRLIEGWAERLPVEQRWNNVIVRNFRPGVLSLCASANNAMPGMEDCMSRHKRWRHRSVGTDGSGRSLWWQICVFVIVCVCFSSTEAKNKTNQTTERTTRSKKQKKDDWSTCSFFRFINGNVFQHSWLRTSFLIYTVRYQM